MTRSFGASRTSSRRTVHARRRPRDGAFTALGFACFRLEAIADPGPDEPDYTAVELIHTMNAMGAFMLA